MNWRARRQTIYLSALFGAVLVVLLALFLPRLARAPSCSDGKQNGGETGVDCGGACALACPAEVKELAVLWRRAFPVTANVWNAVAYLENRNVGFALRELRYQFRFYDRQDIYIGEVSGATFLPPNNHTAVFEGGIDLGLRAPYRTVFEITSQNLNWEKIDVSRQRVLNQISVSGKILENANSSPRLSATVKNSSIYNLPAVEAVALIYDLSGNVMVASRTLADDLPASGQRQIFFTWPEPLAGSAGQIEIIVRVNPFDLNI